MNMQRGLYAAIPTIFCLLSTGYAGAQDAAALQSDALPANAIWLESLDLSKIEQGFGEPNAGKSVDKNAMILGGVAYSHGVGTHAVSNFLIDLKGAATKFVAMVGVDDERKDSPDASIVFMVYVDGKKVADSGVMHGGDAPKLLEVDLKGAKKMKLVVGDANNGIRDDHGDWAGAMILLDPDAKVKPTADVAPVTPPRMVTLPTDPKPAIHGARIVGATPGRPFLFLIPATGEGPFTYAAKNLPAGLTLDAGTGIITGALAHAGETTVVLSVKGAKGSAKRKLKIVGGDHKLSLTPPMGWNSWNVWANAVDEEKVKISADGMIKSGLASHGFNYINIDDCWEAGRNADGTIQTNSKFPDMKALGDYVHGKGLHFGIYSSPGPKTCGNYEASYQHEQQDANSYASWGVDYLKYDWCSYGGIAPNGSLAELRKPYIIMRDALDKSNRDIVYSLCQYGMGDVWKWGGDNQVGGNCWRTTGDITDNWGSLHSIYTVQDGHEKTAGPGHWNDPDMLIVGRVGWGNPHPSRLTPNEQILHISMWCLLSSPLLIGCDMGQLDSFTTAVLSNDEVLDINQDPLGKPAGRVKKDGEKEVWARPLFDGTTAVGLVNGDTEVATMMVDWATLGLKGSQPVRDLWLHKNAGAFSGKYAVEVPAHGIVLLKIGKPNKAE